MKFKLPKITVYPDCGEGKYDFHKMCYRKGNSVCYRCGQVIDTATGYILISSEKALENVRKQGLAK